MQASCSIMRTACFLLSMLSSATAQQQPLRTIIGGIDALGGSGGCCGRLALVRGVLQALRKGGQKEVVRRSTGSTLCVDVRR